RGDPRADSRRIPAAIECVLFHVRDLGRRHPRSCRYAECARRYDQRCAEYADRPAALRRIPALGTLMPLAASFRDRLKAPIVAAPMFLVSGPELVVRTCNAGIAGTFPALNQRTSEGYEAWLGEIDRGLDAGAAPYGVNLVVHRSNPRLEADLAITVAHRVPFV